MSLYLILEITKIILKRMPLCSRLADNINSLKLSNICLLM